MKWSDKAYIGEGVLEEFNKIRSQIASGDVSDYKNEYAITLAINPDNLLEMIRLRDLSLDYYKSKDPLLVGIASDKDEAIELVRKIIEDVYNTRKDTNVRAFF